MMPRMLQQRRHRRARRLRECPALRPLALEQLEDRRVLAGTFNSTTGEFNFCVSTRFDATDAQIAAIKTAFQDASQILADATDGQHRFGTIRIVDDSGASQSSDYWIHQGAGRAYATYGQFGVQGQHVNLYYPDNIGSGDAAGNAYTIAHEHIHHAYAIADEYSGPDDDGSLPINDPKKAENAPYPAGGDSAALSFSLMDNYFSRGGHAGAGTTYTLNELSVDSNHDPDDDTWQSRMNKKADGTGKSDWDTIKDSKYPATVPAGLPVDAAPAAHNVTFEDGLGGLAAMVVLDRSGSMSSENRLPFAKAGAKVFTSFLEPGDGVGVASFETGTAVDFPLTKVVDAGTIAAANAAIDGISLGGSTNIGGGLLAGLGQITSQPDRSCNEIVVLLSDGDHNTGTSPAAATPELVKEGVTAITVGVGSGISSSGQATLQDIARQTGGKYYRVANSFDMVGLFFRLSLESTGNGLLTQAPVALATGEVKEVTAAVETGAENATLGITIADETDDVTLSVESPSGVVYTETTADPNVTFISSPNSKAFRIATPEGGTWKIILTAGTINTGQFEALAFAENDGVQLIAWVADDTLTYPETVVVHATPQYGGENVVGASVTGTVTRPDGSTVPIVLYDDGRTETGDPIPDDGIYSARFNNYSASGDGTYSFNLTVENTSGMTYGGEQLFAFAGAPSSSKPVPVFTRSASATAVVTNVPATIPQIVSVDPAQAYAGQSLSVTVMATDTNFVDGVTTASFGAGIDVTQVSVVDPLTAVVSIIVASDADLGTRDVRLTTGNEIAELLGGFRVEEPQGGDVTVKYRHGHLWIQGDASPSTLRVTTNSQGALIVEGLDGTTINGDTQPYTAWHVWHVSAWLGQGADKLSLVGVQLHGSLSAKLGGGPDTLEIIDSKIRSTVHVRHGGDSEVDRTHIESSVLRSAVFLYTSQGQDEVDVLDSQIRHTLFVHGPRYGGQGAVDLNLTDSELRGTLWLRLGSGDDQVQLNRSKIYGSLYAKLGDGENQVWMDETYIRHMVSIWGGAGDDQLALGQGNGSTWGLRAGGLAFYGQQGMDQVRTRESRLAWYANFELGDDDDTVSLESTDFSQSVNVLLGSGDDLLDLLAGGNEAHHFRVDGGGGTDTLQGSLDGTNDFDHIRRTRI